MAARHGFNADVTIGGTSLKAFCDSVDLNIDVDTADTSHFGTAWKNSITGQAGGNLTLSGSWDPTASTGPAAILCAQIGAAAASWVFYPGGNTQNQRSATFNALLTSYKESSTVGGKVTFSASLVADGVITFAAVP